MACARRVAAERLATARVATVSLGTSASRLPVPVAAASLIEWQRHRLL